MTEKKKSRVKYLLPMAMADSNIFMNMLYLYTQTYWYFMCIIEIVHIKKNSKKITTKINPPPIKKKEKRKDHCLVDYQIDLVESTSDAVLFLCQPQTSL